MSDVSMGRDKSTPPLSDAYGSYCAECLKTLRRRQLHHLSQQAGEKQVFGEWITPDHVIPICPLCHQRRIDFHAAGARYSLSRFTALRPDEQHGVLGSLDLDGAHLTAFLHLLSKYRSVKQTLSSAPPEQVRIMVQWAAGLRIKKAKEFTDRVRKQYNAQRLKDPRLGLALAGASTMSGDWDTARKLFDVTADAVKGFKRRGRDEMEYLIRRERSMLRDNPTSLHDAKAMLQLTSDKRSHGYWTAHLHIALVLRRQGKSDATQFFDILEGSPELQYRAFSWLYSFASEPDSRQAYQYLVRAQYVFDMLGMTFRQHVLADLFKDTPYFGHTPASILISDPQFKFSREEQYELRFSSIYKGKRNDAFNEVRTRLSSAAYLSVG